MNNVSKEKGEKFESIVEKIYIQIANNERIKAKVEKHPFWMFMNLNGKNSIEQNLFLKEGILLFESKYFAEQFQNLYLLNCDNNVKLVGVSQQHLKEIMYLKDEYKVSVKLFNQFTSDLNKWPYHFWNLDVADIEMYIR